LTVRPGTYTTLWPWAINSASSSVEARPQMSTAHRTSSAISHAATIRARISASPLTTFLENTFSPLALTPTAQ
jgi:hypothetical protein